MTQRANSIAATICLLTVLSGCTVTKPRHTEGEARKPVSDGKISADAYLFDTRVVRDHKLASMRLEIFDADSVIALSGRAYLGKGALRGRVTRDSVILYFPTSNQYIAEPTDRFMQNDSCTLKITKDQLLKILRHQPPTVQQQSSGEFIMAAMTTSEARMLATWCKKVFELKYFLTPDGWCLSNFMFDDSLSTQIEASRREVKFGARVKRSQFQVQIPTDAIRVAP